MNLARNPLPPDVARAIGLAPFALARRRVASGEWSRGEALRWLQFGVLPPLRRAVPDRSPGAMAVRAIGNADRAAASNRRLALSVGAATLGAATGLAMGGLWAALVLGLLGVIATAVVGSPADAAPTSRTQRLLIERDLDGAEAEAWANRYHRALHDF